MKIIWKIILCFLIFWLPYLVCHASSDEILEEQKDSLNISGFIKEADKYSKSAFPDIDVNELLNSAIKGKITTNKIYSSILNILGKEVVNSIKVLRKCPIYYSYSQYFKGSK